MHLKEKSCSSLLIPSHCRGRRLLEGLLSGESYKRQNFTGGNNNCFSDDIKKIAVFFLNLHVSVFWKALVLLGFFVCSLKREVNLQVVIRFNCFVS